VKNFRFNDSPLFMLNNLEMLGRPERLAGTEAGGAVVVPAIKVGLNFTACPTLCNPSPRSVDREKPAVTSSAWLSRPAMRPQRFQGLHALFVLPCSANRSSLLLTDANDALPSRPAM
jgi:hypothetical protein